MTKDSDPDMPPYAAHDAPTPEMLDRYWRGEASMDDLLWLERWAESHPDNIQPLTDLGNVLHSRGFSGYTAEERAVKIAAILDTANLSSHTSQPAESSTAVPAARRRNFIYGSIAVLANLVLLWVGWQGALIRTNRTLDTERSVYTTGPGERATITLPDSSIVLLNVASRLEIPAGYTSKNRTLYLSGEAFFTVRTNSRVPFTVNAGPSMVRVLGTSFGVRHYDSDTLATVTVRDGRVSVKAGNSLTGQNSETILSANQFVTVNRLGVSEVRPTHPDQFGFSQGILVLNEARLVDAIPDINRWYNADLRIGDSVLSNRRVEGRFTAGSVSDLAEVLEWTLNLRVVREGRVITLYRKTE